MTETKELSFGERVVRTEFNPSKNDEVSQLKQRSAELINLIEDMIQKKENPNSEWTSLALRAQQEIEVGCMLAVKAATA